MKKEKEIVLKSEKKIKLSELTDEQRSIYNAGCEAGEEVGSTIAFFIALIAIICITLQILYPL
jgi:hypothetical protein